MDFQQFGGTDAGECSLENARIAVLPLCYEHRVSYGTGTGEGPRHILEASSQLEMLDDETFVNWSHLGIHTLAPLTPSSDPETAVFEMKEAAQCVLDWAGFSYPWEVTTRFPSARSWQRRHGMDRSGSCRWMPTWIFAMFGTAVVGIMPV